MSKENIDKLRKENDALKSQLGKLSQDLEVMKNKMASIPDSSNDDKEVKEISKSIEFLSKGFDEVKSFKPAMEKDLKKLSTQLQEISMRVYVIDEAIEDIYKYSYQYNVKIFGIPQRNRRESALESADICLKLFSKIGVNSISLSDIDIAHRVPNRRPSNFPPAIVCKFTRRLAKEQVMGHKKEASKIDVNDVIGHGFGSSPQENTRVKIFDHLTPRAQEILRKAKQFQKDNDYKYCWTTNSVIYLKEDDDSRAVKITSMDILDTLS